MKEKDLQEKIKIIEQDTQDRLRKDFPALYWGKIIVVNSPRVRLGIDDISYRAGSPLENDIETLQLTCKGWLEIYDAKNLAYVLSEKLSTLLRTINKKKTILIFPGNGARVVRNLLPEELLDGIVPIEIPTQRKVNQNGTINGIELDGKTVVRETIAQRKAETILVMDDVIVTGSTLNAIQQAFPMRNLEWFGASLMMLSPLQRRGKSKIDSGVEGYNSIISPVIYQGITGIPPLNSLSTLIGNSEKSQVVRRSYMQDYVEDKEAFLKAVYNIQQKFNGGEL